METVERIMSRDLLTAAPDERLQDAAKRMVGRRVGAILVLESERLAGILTEQNLGGSVTATDATPRRLVIRAEGVREAQPDETKTVMGPPVSSGKGAAQGFAKKLGTAIDDLRLSCAADELP